MTFGAYKWHGLNTVSTRKFGRTPSAYMKEVETEALPALVITDWDTPRVILITPERYLHLLEFETMALGKGIPNGSIE